MKHPSSNAIILPSTGFEPLFGNHQDPNLSPCSLLVWLPRKIKALESLESSHFTLELEIFRYTNAPYPNLCFFWVIRVELSISPQDTHFTNDHWANCLAHPTWFSLVFHQQMTSFLLGFSSSFSEKTTCSNTLKSTLFSCLMLEVLDLMLRRGLQGRRIPGIVLKLALGHVNPPSWCSIVSEVGLQVGSLGFDLW